MFRTGIRVSLVITRNYCSRVPFKKPEQSALVRGVNKAFGKYLLLTNTVSSGALMFLGDIFQQEIEFQQKKLKKRYDYGRLWRMFVVGLALGPLHHYYYSWLNRWMPDRLISTVTKKILLDQIVMSPICILAFFYGMGAMEKHTFKDMNKEIEKKFIDIYLVDWAIWPPTQFINFYYVPVKYQVIYINGITTIYNVFLSYIKHREHLSNGEQTENFKEALPMKFKRD